jgi:hypothetical protein
MFWSGAGKVALAMTSYQDVILMAVEADFPLSITKVASPMD